MAARRRRRRGLVLAVGALALSLAAIALLVARPARVVGVSEGTLADSLRAEMGAERTSCLEIEGGRASGTVWRCTAGRTALYAIQVDDWGCWKAERLRRGTGERRLEACIWLGDFVPVLD